MNILINIISHREAWKLGSLTSLGGGGKATQAALAAVMRVVNVFSIRPRVLPFKTGLRLFGIQTR